MGRRGPRPEPAAVKAKKGNPGNRPLGEDPVEPSEAADKTMPSPAWLDGEGLEVWKRLAPRLVAMNLLRRIDVETFGRYCRNFARWLKMNKQLDEAGETYSVESEHGSYIRANPAFLIADRLERQLLAAEANFGLNPAERQRIFAARAALGAIPGLFDGTDVPASAQRPAPTAPAKPKGGKVAGFLN